MPGANIFFALFRLAIISDILQITPVSTARMERYNNLLKNATVVAQVSLPTLHLHWHLQTNQTDLRLNRPRSASKRL